MDLFAAIDAGDVDRVRQLLGGDRALAGGRHPDTGVSAVLSARYRQRMDVVDAVLAAGPELDLFDAAGLGHIDRLRQLLDEQPDGARAWSADGFTALHLAAFFGQPETAAVLLRAGADPMAVARNPMLVQPLHSAAAGRCGPVAAVLLVAGADANVQQHGGWTPLHSAAAHGDVALAELLLAFGADPSVGNEEGRLPRQLAEEAGHHHLAGRLG